MAYPGPWKQGADYTRSPSYLYNQVAAPYGSQTKSFTGGGPPLDDEMNAALDQAGTDTTQMAGPGTSLGVTSTRADAGYVSGDIGVEKQQGGGEWTAADLLDLAYYDSMVRASMPADATGVEYDSTTVTLVAGALHVEFGADGRDSTAPAGTPLTAINASLLLTIQGGQAYGSAATFLASLRLTPGMTAVAFDFDMTPLMGPQGQCGIATTGSKDTLWHYYDPNQLGLIRVGTTVGNPQMVYTLHPPRHRFLYATPQVMPGLPPLRQHPRSDGMRRSGAARHYPASRSAQASNRHAGGYF